MYGVSNLTCANLYSGIHRGRAQSFKIHQSSDQRNVFAYTFVMVPYPTIICNIGLIPFRISLLINSMFC